MMVWPEHGAVTLNNLQMCYRFETPLVLKGHNVLISGGEQIGVVGRAGSGKSSLSLVLMHIIKPSISENVQGTNYDAPLIVDDGDVMCISLHDLRMKLGIILQLPV